MSPKAAVPSHLSQQGRYAADMCDEESNVPRKEEFEAHTKREKFGIHTQCKSQSGNCEKSNVQDGDELTV